MKYQYTRQGNITVSIPCELVYREASRYQDIAIIDTDAWGRCLILDGVVNTSSNHNDVIHESLYGIPLLSHPAPRRVLILGGGDLFGARMCLSWKGVERVDMVEIDSKVVSASKKYLHKSTSFLNDPRLNLTIMDAMFFLQEKNLEYDVIVVDMTDPFGISSALFGEEFALLMKGCMNKASVLSTQCDSPDTIGDDFYRIISSYSAHFQVSPYRVWIPPYLEMFGRLLVSSSTRLPKSVVTSAYPFTWLTDEMEVSMFHHKTVTDARMSKVTSFTSRDSTSVQKWSIE